MQASTAPYITATVIGLASILSVAQLVADDKPAQSEGQAQVDPQILQKRFEAKVKVIEQAVQKRVDEGNPPFAAVQQMESFQPLMADGKLGEADALLDSVLKELGQDPEPINKKFNVTLPGQVTAGSPTVAELGKERDPIHELVKIVGEPALILVPEVAVALGLDAEKLRLLEDARQGAKQGVGEFLKAVKEVPPQARGQALDAFRQQAGASLREISASLLDAGQQKRLHQIALQRRGVLSLADKQIAADAGLTAEQHTTIGQIALEPARATEAGRRELTAKIEGMLSPDQKRRWKEMVGEPLNVKLPDLPD